MGKTKIAEEDLSKQPQALQQHVQTIFSKGPAKAEPSAGDLNRDKETYSLEFNGTNLPLNTIRMNDDLQKLIAKMKGNLKYKKS